MKRHLVLCSVPWRAASLSKCLAALHTQPIDQVTVLRAPGDWPCLESYGAEFVDLKHNYGPEVRWRFIRQTFAPDTLALVLDDDFVPDPDYTDRTVSLIEQDRADATGWYGVDTGLGYIPIARGRVKEPRPMLVLAGGACAMRAWTLARVEDDELYLRSADDAASSKSMRQMGARMFRPPGRAPLRSTSAQFDLRSIKLSRSPDSAKLFVADYIRGD